MPVVTKRITRKRPSISVGAVIRWFEQWVVVKDEASVLGERQDDLHDRILDGITKLGVKDDKGSYWLDLPNPVQFTDHDGKVFKYTTLKRERHLSPAAPTPDPRKAEALLRKLKLWMKPDQEKALQALQDACPYLVFSVSIDPDALAKAYFSGRITESDYASCLREQKESFQFRPGES